MMALSVDSADLVDGDATTGATPAAARRSPLATWRFAARLARREVRRRPGRTALVALLVAVPVVAMLMGSVLYRTTSDDWAATFARRAGAADLVAESPLAEGRAASLHAVLPAGSRVVDVVSTSTGIELADGTMPYDVWVEFTDLPVHDPLLAGVVEVLDGRPPTSSGELLVDRRTADRVGASVGDTVDLARPSGSWTIVGIGRLADDHRKGLMVVAGFPVERLRPERSVTRSYVELPAGADRADGLAAAIALDEQGLSVEHRWGPPDWVVAGEGAEARTLAWGWVVGVLGLAATGVVIAAAFATSARRQLVTLGQLSANGGSPALVRRSLALQGSWTGLVGTVLALALATAGLVVGRSTVERLVNRTLGGYRVAALDVAVVAFTAVVAATVAAAVPAWGAARVPVVSAIAGRRPLASPPRRLPGIALVLFVSGLGLLAVAATGARAARVSDVFAIVAVVGGAAVMLGMCCATPVVVAALGRLGGWLRGAWRLAARSIARSRTRSAAVVAAVALAAAFAVAGSTMAAMQLRGAEDLGAFPNNAVYVEHLAADPSLSADGDTLDPGPLEPLTVSADLRRELTRILPEAAWTPVRAAAFDPRPFDASTGPSADDPASMVQYQPRLATIADPALLRLTPLTSADRNLLATNDLVMVLPDGSPLGATATKVIARAEGGDIEASMAEATSGWAGEPFSPLISPERVDALGLDVVEVGVVLAQPKELSPRQRAELARVAGERSAFVEPGDPPSDEAARDSDLVVLYAPPRPDRTSAVGQNLALVAVAIVVTLLVVGIGLALSAAESRDERNVLVAVGASPHLLSRIAGTKALLLAGTGVVLGMPTGYLPTWTVYKTLGSRPVALPLATMLVLVVAVPLVAGLAAGTASAASRWFRPVRVSRWIDE